MEHLLRYSRHAPLEIITPDALDELVITHPENGHEVDRHVLELYERCARHMRDGRVDRALAFGPFVAKNVDLSRFIRDKKVRVPKGVAVCTTGPRERYVSARANKVRIRNSHAGYTVGGSFSDLRHPEFCWVGAGKYFYTAALNDVLMKEAGLE
jgi:hypothetical protein